MKNAGLLDSFGMWLTNQALKTEYEMEIPLYIRHLSNKSPEEVKEKWGQIGEKIKNYMEKFTEQWVNKLVYQTSDGRKTKPYHRYQNR